MTTSTRVLIARQTETPPQGEARCGHEKLPEEGKHEHEAPLGALPQKGERKPEALPRMCERERARMKIARLAGAIVARSRGAHGGNVLLFYVGPVAECEIRQHRPKIRIFQAHDQTLVRKDAVRGANGDRYITSCAPLHMDRRIVDVRCLQLVVCGDRRS